MQLIETSGEHWMLLAGSPVHVVDDPIRTLQRQGENLVKYSAEERTNLRRNTLEDQITSHLGPPRNRLRGVKLIKRVENK
jgi:hypothetical protein